MRSNRDFKNMIIRDVEGVSQQNKVQSQKKRGYKVKRQSVLKITNTFITNAFVKKVLAASLLAIIIILLVLGMYCREQLNSFESLETYDKFMTYVDTGYDYKLQDYPFDDDLRELPENIDDNFLKENASISFVGESGVKYWFGLDYVSENQLNDIYEYQLVLNPLTDSERNIGFFVYSNYGAFVKDVAEDALKNEEWRTSPNPVFGILNNLCGFESRFKSDENLGAFLAMHRCDELYYIKDDWNVDVIAFYTDTLQIVDAFQLEINEFSAEGKIIPLDETHLDGWWKITGAHSIERQNLFPKEYTKRIGDAALSQYNTNNTMIVGDSVDSAKVVNMYTELKPADNYIITESLMYGYATTILRMDLDNNQPMGILERPKEMIYAVTPVYNEKDVKSVNSIITVYFRFVDKNGEDAVSYIGFSDFMNNKSVSNDIVYKLE